MKDVYCSRYNFDCCQTCRNLDEFHETTYKEFTVYHCCKTLKSIELDIEKHLDRTPENDCE